jgi:hypothetical protein
MTWSLLKVNNNDNKGDNSWNGTKNNIDQSPVMQKIVADSDKHARNTKSRLKY